MTKTDEELAVHYTMLRRRAARLARLLALPGKPLPAAIVGREVHLLMMAVLGYCGTEVRHWWFSWLDDRVRVEAGLCRSCGRARDSDPEFCAACIHEFEQMDLEAEDPVGGIQ